MYTLRIATSKTEMENIFKLRYRAFTEKYGTNLDYVDLVNKQITDPLEKNSINVGAWHNDELIGCVRINTNDNKEFAGYSVSFGMGQLTGLSPDKYCMVTKLAVDPKHANSRVNVLLQQFCYKTGLENHMEYCFIDCRSELVKYYQKFGFKTYTDKIFENEFGYYTIPMVLDVYDIDHLKQIRSPLASVYEAMATENTVMYAQAA